MGVWGQVAAPAAAVAALILIANLAVLVTGIVSRSLRLSLTPFRYCP